MEIIYFPKLKVGEVFVVDGERFRKHDELTYTDIAGIQRYIDPLFDVKVGKWLAEVAATAAPQVDTSAKIVGSENEENNG